MLPPEPHAELRAPELRAYVISLTRSAERRQRFAAHNAHLPYRFFDAVDGGQQSRDRLQAAGFLTPDASYTDGAIGCALSHVALWDHAVVKQQPVLVLEDDVLVHPGFLAERQRLLQTLPPDWDFIAWSHNDAPCVSYLPMAGQRPAVLQYMPDAALNPDEYMAAPLRSNLHRLIHHLGIGAYEVSPKGAALLKAGCLPLQKRLLNLPELSRSIWEYGIDMAMAQLYPQMQAFVALPPPILSPNDKSDSTVQPDAFH